MSEVVVKVVARLKGDGWVTAEELYSIVGPAAYIDCVVALHVLYCAGAIRRTGHGDTASYWWIA
jgi:hypothetical protein